MKINEIISKFSEKDFEIIGNLNLEVKNICSIFEQKEESCTWVSSERQINWKEDISCSKLLIVTSDETIKNLHSDKKFNNIVFLLTQNPKYFFSEIFKILIFQGYISSGSWNGCDRFSNENFFNNLSFIADGVINTQKGIKIGPGTFIHECVEIQNNVLIGPGNSIGGDGFGFYENYEGKSFRMPHIGKVILEENVELGANVNIDRGTIGDTILKNNVKVDALVHIAHNVVIGKNTKIVANAMLCGSCTIGDNSWIGGNTIVREGLKIGNDCLVGIGSVVTKNIPDNEVWAGNPAKFIRKIKL